MSALRRQLLPAATILGIAAVLRLAFDGWYLNFDARFALLWARDAVRGLTPDYTTPYAPTPHPLETAVSVLALPFGSAGAGAVMGWLVLLCFGALVWVVFRIGSELFGTAAGVVAAVVVVTRPKLLRDALIGYQDPAFALAIAGAVLLELRRPRRGAAVMALLTVAGLMRPEAWVLAGLYALYLRRPAYLALAAVAPVIWALSDLIVTGDALHSLHGTSALAETADRRRSLGQAPYWTAQYFGSTLREPLLLGIPVGLAFAWLRRREQWPRWAVPVAVATVMTAVFMAGPVFGLPLIGRYVRTPSVLMTVFFGLALVGWRALPAGTDRTRWAVAAAAVAAVFLAFVPANVSMIDSLHGRIARDGRDYAALRDAVRAPAVRAAFAACGRTISASEHAPIPYVRWWIDGPPGSVTTPEQDAAPLQPLIVSPRGAPAPAGYVRLHRNRAWHVDAAPRCAA